MLPVLLNLLLWWLSRPRVPEGGTMTTKEKPPRLAWLATQAGLMVKVVANVALLVVLVSVLGWALSEVIAGDPSAAFKAVERLFIPLATAG